MDSPSAKKSAFEDLSKDQLIKKCKSVIVLAQKAKQAKDEAVEEVQKNATLIETLQARCDDTEKKFKKETCQTERLREQLIATQELLASQQKALTDTEIQLTFAKEQLAQERSNAEVSSSVKAQLETKLATLTEALNFKEVRLLELERSVEEKDIIATKLEESNENLKLLEQMLTKTNEENREISEQQDEVEELLSTKEHESLSPWEYVLKKVKEMEDQRLSLKQVLEAKDERKKLEEQMQSKLTSVMEEPGELQTCNTELEKFALESKNSNFQEELNSLRTEVALLRGSVVKEEDDKSDKVRELQGRNTELQGNLKEKEVDFKTLEKSIARLESEKLELHEELHFLQNEFALNKDSLLEAKEKASLLEELSKQLEILNLKNAEQCSTIEILKSESKAKDEEITQLTKSKQKLHDLLEENEKLRKEFALNKDSLLEAKENASLLEELSKQLEILNLKNAEHCSTIEILKSESKAKDEEITQLTKPKQKLHDLFEENEKLRKALTHAENTATEENSKLEQEILKLGETLRANSDALLAKDDMLRVKAEALHASEELLRAKEAIISDLEQEVSRLRDGIFDTTNTEVSSTLSMSRSEVQSRLNDFEDSFEDKYTKLRVVAVKLKKRYMELSKTLESERIQIATERTELQSKISQLTAHAKTTQMLQAEVDRLLDAVEEERKKHLSLKKDFEKNVHDASQTKLQLVSFQETLEKVVKEKESLEASIASMEASLNQALSFKNEVERLTKDNKEKDLLLERNMEEKQKLRENLDKALADAKKKGVLSLEMADMEKSVEDLTQQLNAEKERLRKAEIDLDKERSTVSDLNEKLRMQVHLVNEQENKNADLREKLASMQKLAEERKVKLDQEETSVQKLTILLEEQRATVENLRLECADLAAKHDRESESARNQMESLSRQIFQLEELCSALRDAGRVSEEELATVRTEFESYKVRAQSVLRQSTKSDERSSVKSAVQDVEDLELEVEKLRVFVDTLKTSLHQATTQLQAALQEVNSEREERTRLTKTCQSLRESLAQAVERQHVAEERLAVTIEEGKQAKLHADTLVLCYKQQLEEIKSSHAKKFASLMEQMETMQSTVSSNSVKPTDNQLSVSVSETSPVADWAANAHPDTDLSGRVSSLHREEGEGSESVDSFPSRRISVTTQDRRHELIPLDKLLSSPSYPEDGNGIEHVNFVEINVEALQSKLTACESRAAHLTALLSEAESDAARLSQLNAVLKEEIRRQQRSEERTQHAHNLEYLKNIVLKFFTLQSGDERQHLVPVLNTILKLSPEEASMIELVAKGSTQVNPNARSWGSYLPLPGWSGT